MLGDAKVCLSSLFYVAAVSPAALAEDFSGGRWMPGVMRRSLGAERERWRGGEVNRCRTART